MFEKIIIIPIEENDPKSTQLHLTDHKLSDEQAQRLAVALSKNTFIESIIFDNTSISSVGMGYLCEVIQESKTLVSFEFSRHKLNDEEAKKLLDAIAVNKSIKSLKFCHGAITPRGEEHLRQVVFSGTGIEYLCEVIKKTKTLASLDLSNNKFDDKDMEKLSDAIAVNNSLESLKIYGANITPKGVEYLRRAVFKNYKLLSVDVEWKCHRALGNYLERNGNWLNNPKIAFDASLLGGYSPRSRQGLSLEDKKYFLRRILSVLLRDCLDIQLVSLFNLSIKLPINFPVNLPAFLFHDLKPNLGNQEQLRAIDGELDNLADSLPEIEIDGSIQLIGDQSRLELANFLNYLFDTHQSDLEKLIRNLCEKRVPDATKQDTDRAVSDFMEIIYGVIITGHKESLIREWISQYSNFEIPLPTGKEEQQILLEQALINAAAHGDARSIKLFIHYVKHLNTPDSLGLTALDYAQCYSIHKNDSACFDLLRNAGTLNSHIDFGIKEKTFNVMSVAKKKEALLNIFRGILNPLLVGYIAIMRQSRGSSSLAKKPDDDEIIDQELLQLIEKLKISDIDYLLKDQLDENELGAYLRQYYEEELNKAVMNVFEKTVNAKPDPVGKHSSQSELEKDRELKPEVSAQEKERARLIRVWVSAYHLVSEPLPKDEKQLQSLLEGALGKAAKAGAYYDVLRLIDLVDNINAKTGPLQQTALHRAAIYAKRSCFEALRKAGADLQSKDIKGKTPLDLWDFTKNPDFELQELPSTNQNNTEFGCSVM